MYSLNADFVDNNPITDSVRAGFGRGLLEAGYQDENVVALCADLTESLQMHHFKDTFGTRFIEVGVAEQNLVTVASGMARAGKIPFAASYASFSPGRNWEQIRTTICINDMPVKLVGGHAGLTVGPDGATHQMLEDIAMMRVLPNMVVLAPGDAIEAKKATLAMAKNDLPNYIRLCRDKTPIFSTDESPFEIGKAYILREGIDVSLFGTGIMTAELLRVADNLAIAGINAEVVHVPTIKPLDAELIIASARKTGRVITAEEAQVAGGFGSAVAETLVEKLPTPLLRIGVLDRFGESGSPAELMSSFGLSAAKIVPQVQEFIKQMPRYHQGF